MSDLASDVASIDILTNIDLLRNTRAPVEARREAARYLAAHPNKVALPVMIRALEDPDFDIRKHALTACEAFLSPLSVEALIKVLRERTFSEREDAARILGKIRDRRAVQPVADALLYSDWMAIRSTAALALGEIGSPEGVGPLIEALGDFEAPVRTSVADALGQLKDVRAVGPLVEGMKKEKGWHIRHFASALANLGEAALMPLIAELANMSVPQAQRELLAETLADIIIHLSHPEDAQAAIKLTVDLLVAELPTRDEGIRSYVARAALTRMSHVISDHLINAFASQNQALRDQVAYILGDSQDPALNDKLITALRVANEQVAAGAARVLYFRGIDPRDYDYSGAL
ncbi:MAG: HEAT repeat domain-containing protein [Anaerolineae bacterium]|nr:HEAT repeat domain-containing protein [Anaerolineae bacterium]